MNQIMNVAAIGMGSSTGSKQRELPRKPAHAKASLAARKDSEGSFRIPRGGRSVAAPAADNAAEDKQPPARPARHNADQDNGRHDSNGNKGNRRNRRCRKGGHGKGGPDKRKVLIALLIVALLLGGFGIWKFMNLSPEEATVGSFYDQSASEIQEAVDHEVEDGYFNMSINTSVPVFEDNSAAIGIRNIESNQYDCIVTVTLNDGTEVYKSGGLAPGSELEMVTLTHKLEPGDYEATAVFEIIEQNEAHTVAGQTASKLTLHVL